ncbi:cytochrome b/b6 domain-containing protein [Qingshengfaniella alkalisoli]|uniref:Cytochrome n=1 Tax=Qingshengfaniella alkalisoli TaxID=2599296 RepID=A0A5B8I673_9RHOB|nr:cytochrome b/b6 domain-containing protein [Qingshengfaniella alkalisoli]QDY68909.1 cytochrome [Qingshengfaniella alkalisoli]
MTSTVTDIRNTAHQYGAVAKAFHWVTAALILSAITLGFIAGYWPYEPQSVLEAKYALFSIHKTIGVTIFFVALARIVWALSQPKPGLLHPDRRLETWLAETVHWLLYGLLVATPLSGWIHHAALTGFAPIWWPFGQTLPFVPQSPEVAEFFGAWHYVLTRLLIVTLVLHIAGAIKHHAVDRDQTLQRMLPGRTDVQTPEQSHSRVATLSGFGLLTAALIAGTVLGMPAGDHARDTNETTATSDTTSWLINQGNIDITVLQAGKEVSGQFGQWSADIRFDPEASGPDFGEVTTQIDISSLTLGGVTEQALGPSYFAADEFPTAVFEGVITQEGADKTDYIADGALILKGVTVPVTLPFTLQLDGNVAQMSGQITLDRRDFGIGDAGSEGTVGFEVVVDIALEAQQQ